MVKAIAQKKVILEMTHPEKKKIDFGDEDENYLLKLPVKIIVEKKDDDDDDDDEEK